MNEPNERIFSINERIIYLHSRLFPKLFFDLVVSLIIMLLIIVASKHSQSLVEINNVE